jgi:hypothetical protein
MWKTYFWIRCRLAPGFELATCREYIGQLRQSSALIGQLGHGSALIGQLGQSSALIGQLGQSSALIGQLRQSSALRAAQKGYITLLHYFKY